MPPADSIIDARQRLTSTRVRKLDAPGVEGPVYIACLSVAAASLILEAKQAGERSDRKDDGLSLYALIVALSASDDRGSLLFGESDEARELVRSMPLDLVKFLAEEAMKFSGLTEDTSKNS